MCVYEQAKYDGVFFIYISLLFTNCENNVTHKKNTSHKSIYPEEALQTCS